MLSPNAPFADAAPYNSSTKKILILMTDGYNTNQPDPNIEYSQGASSAIYGPGEYYNDEPNDGTADATTAQVCQNIQAAGISVYTIAFEVTNSTIKNILSNCASAPANYYDASDIVGLQNAFQNISQQLASARLTQ